MAKKTNRRLYKLYNPNTGTFYMTSFNRLSEIPEELSKFDKKTRAHEQFKVKKMK